MSVRLVLAAHGSPHAAHAAAVEQLRAAVAAGWGEVTVGWLEHAEPTLPDAVAEVARRGPLVVVPLLLAAGYHAQVDLPRLVGERPGVVVAPVLGPDPLLAAALDRRLCEAGADPGAVVVLAGAGSSDPVAQAEVAEAARLLGAHRGCTVAPAGVAGSGPRVADVVVGALSHGRPVAVATYLLGPGVLADRVREVALAAGAATVSAPVGVAAAGAAPEVVALVRLRALDALGIGRRAA